MAKNKAKNRNSDMDVEPVVEQPEEQLSESYISIGLGLLVVIVVGVLLYNFFQSRKNANTPETSSATDTVVEEASPAAAKAGGTYTVVAGDTLWSISEKAYGTGYEWKTIADANNLKETDALEAGRVVKIPELAAKASGVAMASAAATAAPVVVATPVATVVPVATVAPVASPEAAKPAASVQPAPSAAATAPSITGTSYTIVAGDTLWSIACRAYGDCYQWPKLAAANKLSNPNWILAGNTLSVPR